MILREKYFEQFAANCLAAVDLTRRKNLGYTAGSDDPFANFRTAAELATIPGKDPVTVAQTILSRIADKISRFKSLTSNPANNVLNDESLKDTLMDFFVYANILLVWEQLGQPEPGTGQLDVEYVEQDAPEAVPEPRTVGQQLSKLFNWNQAKSTNVTA